MATTITLTQDVYEPLELPADSFIALTNDNAGYVDIRELSPGASLGEVKRLKLDGHGGTPPVYLGTEGGLTIVPAPGNLNFPRAMPLDETAVLTWTDGMSPTGGAAWLLAWE